MTELTFTTLCALLTTQLTAAPWTGSWPYALPQNSQPTSLASGATLPTSFALYEIKRALQTPGRFLPGTACGKTSPSDITAAGSLAKSWLIGQANGNGGFAERNPQSGALEASNVLVTAFAIRALDLYAAEGDAPAATAVNAARTFLINSQSADGSWGGDALLTARAIAALPGATGTQIADADNDGIPNVVEVLLGTAVNVADSQNPLPTTSNSSPGITATNFAATGTVETPFSYTITVAGTGPFTFVQTGGVLPIGLSLAGNGNISGVPTRAGSFAFDYEVTDAASAKTLLIGRIDIAAQQTGSPAADDAPLPAWALAMMAAGLFAVRRRMRS